MQSDIQATPPPPSSPEPGLPPVTPPSGQMILRLFLVPGLIVAGLVGLFLAGPLLANWIGGVLGRTSGDARTAEQFLRDLDNSNPEVRWRAASDLAQILLRKDALAADVGFAFQLSDRLDQVLQASAPAEKSFAERHGGLTDGEKARELKKLEADRNYIMFLSACLGNFMVPVGAPQLVTMSLQEGGMEPRALAERRLRAIWALGTLGENLKRFDGKLSNEGRDAIEKELETNIENGKHVALARLVLNHLRLRRQGKPDALGVPEALVRCADDGDPAVRGRSAFALNFWVGSPAEETAVEKRLVQLTRDDGRGEDELNTWLDGNPGSKVSRDLTKKKGFQVQAQAAIALARRGSARTPLGLLEEMLDEGRLREVFVVQDRRTGAEQPNEALVQLTVSQTLRALVELRHKRPAEGARLKERFGARVDALAQHANVAIRTEARRAQLALNGEG